MRRLLFAFFMILIVVPSHAENWIKFKSDVVEKAINQLVASENRQSAADEYQKNMNKSNGKISVSGVYKVCIASGFNIQTNDGYNLCRNFLNFMISESNFGTEGATQKNCANLFNGVWTLSSDGKQYQCVGRDGYLLVYKKSCRDGGGTCIKQFAGLKTQGPNGREFINAYGKLKGINFTCHADADISTFGQDYIRCSAAGKAYEFEFDSLNQTPNSTSSDSENKAICELYGGKIVNTGDKYIENIWQSCDVSRNLCDGVVRTLAMSTGHTVQYQGYCRLSREIKTVSTDGLNQIEGIDNRIFYNAGSQMRMDTAKPMVEEYLRTKFPNETYIVCGATPKILNEGLGIDKDYVVSCTVGSRRIDFVFDDISETLDSDAAAGMDAMQCIISGGTFKGESCRGPTKEECKKLDSVLRAKGSDKGARYDDEARACILGNAESKYKRDVAVGYITGAVVIVGGALVTIGTGGAAGPVVVNGVAMLAGDIAINYAIDANHQRLTNKAAKKFVDFVTDAEACKTEQCAIDVLEKHYATLSGVMSDLNTDDQAVVDETMDKLIGLIKTEFVACGKDDSGKTIYASPADCAMQSSRLTLLDRIDPYSEAGLAIGSVIFDPGYVVTRFMRLKKVTKVASVATDAARATNKLDDAADTLNRVTEARLMLQKQAETAKNLLVNNVDLIKNASNIEEAEKYADEASQLAFVLQNQVDEAASIMAGLLKNNTEQETVVEALRVAQQYKDDIERTAKQAKEIADQSRSALEAKRVQLNKSKMADVEAAIAKADARRTNTSEYITEPVMYFRAIDEYTAKSPEEMVKILNDAGIHASLDASDKTAWVINKSSVSSDGRQYELISPFLSPESAAEQFDIVNDILQDKGVKLIGAVTPTTISQIDPTVVTGVSRTQAHSNIRKYFEDNKEILDGIGLSIDTATDEDLLNVLIARTAFNGFQDEASVAKQYDAGNVLFRGQKFSTSDVSSAYANMAPKPGTSGNSLATVTVGQASGYSGANGWGSNGGAGLSASYVGEQKVGSSNVGFLNVYENNEQNVFYVDTGIENMTDTSVDPPLSNPRASSTAETLITPRDNPVIARYIVIDGRYTKLDENSTTDRLIMDAFAPDLSKTYGEPMLQRIENVKSGMTDGTVQTYDLSTDVMSAFGN